jgi:hypothetical protein
MIPKCPYCKLTINGYDEAIIHNGRTYCPACKQRIVLTITGPQKLVWGSLKWNKPMCPESYTEDK